MEWYGIREADCTISRYNRQDSQHIRASMRAVFQKRASWNDCQRLDGIDSDNGTMVSLALVENELSNVCFACMSFKVKLHLAIWSRAYSRL